MKPDSILIRASELSHNSYKSKPMTGAVKTFIPHDFNQGSSTFFNDTLKATIYEEGDNVFVVFRGSDNATNWIQGNLGVGVNKELPKYYADFSDQVAQKVFELYGNQQKKISYTGHSAGVLMGIHAHSKHVQNNNWPQSQVFGFDAPDCKFDLQNWNHVHIVQSNSAISGLNYSKTNAHIYSINPGGNPISNHFMENIVRTLTGSQTTDFKNDSLEGLCSAFNIGEADFRSLSDDNRRLLSAKYDEMRHEFEAANIKARVERASNFYKDISKYGDEFHCAGLTKIGKVGSNLVSMHENLIQGGFGGTGISNLFGSFADISSGLLSVTSFINPYIALFSAGKVILQVFGVGRKKQQNQVDPTLQAMLSAINNLQKYLEREFKQLYEQNQEIIYFCENISRLVTHGIDDVRSDLTRAVNTLVNVQEKIMLSELFELIDKIETRSDTLDVKMAENIFMRWSKYNPLHSVLNGQLYSQEDGLDVISNRVQTNQRILYENQNAPKHMGYLVARLKQEGITHPSNHDLASGDIVFIPVWVKAVTAYLQFIDTHQPLNIELRSQMIKSGENALQFIQYLRENSVRINENSRENQQTVWQGPILNLLQTFAKKIENLELAVFRLLKNKPAIYDNYKKHNVLFSALIREIERNDADSQVVIDLYQSCKNLINLLYIVGPIAGFSKQFSEIVSAKLTGMLDESISKFISKLQQANQELDKAMNGSQQAVDYYCLRANIQNTEVNGRLPIWSAITKLSSAQISNKKQLLWTIRTLVNKGAAVDSLFELSYRDTAHCRITPRSYALCLGNYLTVLFLSCIFKDDNVKTLFAQIYVNNNDYLNYHVIDRVIAPYTNGVPALESYDSSITTRNETFRYWFSLNLGVAVKMLAIQIAANLNRTHFTNAIAYYDDNQKEALLNDPKDYCCLLWVISMLGNWAVMARVLPRAQASANRFFELINFDYLSPLLIAAQLGHADVVAGLLQLGVSHKTKDEQGRRPFLVACINGQLNVVQQFFGNNIDISEDLPAAFNHALATKNIELAELLINQGHYQANENQRRAVASFSASTQQPYQFKPDSAFGDVDLAIEKVADSILQESAGLEVNPMAVEIRNTVQLAKRIPNAAPQILSSNSSSRPSVLIRSDFHLQMTDCLYQYGIKLYNLASIEIDNGNFRLCRLLLSMAQDRLLLAKIILTNNSPAMDKAIADGLDNIKQELENTRAHSDEPLIKEPEVKEELFHHLPRGYAFFISGRDKYHFAENTNHLKLAKRYFEQAKNEMNIAREALRGEQTEQTLISMLDVMRFQSS